MSIAPKYPRRCDLLREIPKLVEPFCVVLGDFPLAAKLKHVDRMATEQLWRFICNFQGGKYIYRDQSPHVDLHGRGLYFVRRKEAAEVTRTAFIAAFGRGEFGVYDEKECRSLVLDVLASVAKGTSFSEAKYARVERFLFALKAAAEEKILLPVVSQSDSSAPDPALMSAETLEMLVTQKA